MLALLGLFDPPTDLRELSPFYMLRAFAMSLRGLPSRQAYSTHVAPRVGAGRILSDHSGPRITDSVPMAFPFDVHCPHSGVCPNHHVTDPTDVSGLICSILHDILMFPSFEVRIEHGTARAEDIAVRAEQRRIMAPLAIEQRTGASTC